MKTFFIFLITIFASSLAFSQYTIGTVGSVATCSGTFFDSGGSGGNYGDNENKIMTFCSNNSTCIQVDFTEFDIDSSDFLYIYNGANTSSAPIAVLTGSTLPPSFSSFFGCLTFQFVSNDTITSSGWAASLSCGPCLLPGGGNGSLTPSYDNQACGLNYTQVSTKVTTRYATPAGTGLPATLSLTGLPPNNTCWVVEKALLYWTESSQNNNPVTLSIINPNPINNTFNFNVSPIGVGPAKCWSELNSKNFRIDVSAAIVGNGNYTINISSGDWSVDGVTLLVIYRDLTATYTGRLMINDGTMAEIGTSSFSVISNINACATSTSGSAFLMVGDIQDGLGPTYNGTLNGNTYAFPRNFWNFDERPTTVTAGQPSASFGIDPSGDCYSWAAVGLYYQTNCLTCPTNAFSVPINQTSTTCYGSNIKANPGSGATPYQYLWNTGATTQSLIGVPEGTYSVTVTDNIGCIARDTIDVVNTNTPAVSVFNYNICHTDSILLAGSYHNASGTYNDTIFGGSYNGCDSIISHVLVVDPGPTITLSDTIVCDGAPLPTTNFISNPVGATYSWTNSNTAIGLGASGVGNINSFTATNNTPAAITSTITVTPSQNGCVGTPSSYNITVKPSPIVDLLPDLTFCNGDNVLVSNYSSTTPGATFNWTNDNTTIGLGASGNGNAPTFSATNNSTSPINSIISVTATSNGCTGPSTDYTITVDADPTASFTSTNACENSNIQFTDASVGNGGTIDQWEWDFGGGSTSTQQNPSQYFAAAGTYSVELIVTTTNGCSNTIVQDIDVFALPDANFNFDQVCEDATTTFSNTSSVTPVDGDVIDQYDWDFGNGSNSTDENPTLNYGTENIYNVKLVITTNYGCKDSITLPVEVYPLPVANFNATAECLSFATQFTDGSSVSNSHTSNSITSWAWDFDDGNTDNTQNTSHIYSASGVYDAELTVETDKGCITSIVVPVTVYISPVADFDFINACDNEDVLLTSTSTANAPGNLNLFWDVNSDNTTDYTVSPVGHTFNNDGFHDVRLIIETADGCRDTIVKQVTVYALPHASFNVDAVCEDATTTFGNTSTITPVDNDVINQYAWSFGNGTTSTVENPTLNYGTENIYNAKLVITTNYGCKDSIVQAVTVYPLPVVNFSPTEVCLEFATNFIDQSTVSNSHSSNHNVTWAWDFADGTTANVQNPTHTYLSDGVFNTVLTVTTDHNCVATGTIPVTVYPKPVASFAGVDLEGCAPVCPTITSTSTINSPSSIANYKWTFSDGTVYEGSSPYFSDCFDNTSGTDIDFGLLLTVTSDKGCINQHSESNYIKVYHNPVADFYTTPVAPDVLAPKVEFHNTSLYANYYSWTIGYYGQTGETNPIVDFPPDSASYPAELIAYTNMGCTDTVRTVVKILDRLIFYIPNTFTPDNDEFNETFKPIFTSGYDPQSYTLLIFNKWGEVIFESHNVNVGWDGTFGEDGVKIVKDGTYVWKIDFKTSMNDERKTFTGHVNILK